ncbi:SDR family NAD(P)-dependent oxidoreductase [Aquibacillus kalidii]|uniref:SDR family NAD(P)-dependent oxidoreductase n=1 Tax=Aquibacillus kalidii TaxID=2762597 RepID=UPI001644882D|nr:SDR family oxidoreductase [Aquibacillus kalidii]
MTKLRNKNIIITGASSGIGEEIALQVAEQGGNPILVARSVDKLKRMKMELESTYSVKCSFYQADLTDLSEWRRTLHQIMEDIAQVDALINNAGFGIFNKVGETNWEDIERMFQLNVYALIMGTHEILPYFINRREGHIINIGSQAGKIATPKSSVYSATKHAVIGFSNALRLEVEDQGVFVTTVNLGPVRTNFFDMADPSGNYQKAIGRYMLDPEKVARNITKALFTNKREINMPGWMEMGSKFYNLFPKLTERMLKSQFNKK